MMKSYYRFRGDLFKVNYNFEQSATLVSEADNEAIITGVFRTSGDFGALIWGSEDYIKNDYISYKTNYDYRNTKLTFKANFSGYIQPYSDLESEQSLTILNNDGTTNYVALGFCSSTSEGNASMNWTGSNGDLGKNWIKWGSIKATWSKDGKQGICIENQDFKVDYVKGIVSVCAGNKVPYLAEVNLTFEYSNFDNYIIDFNNLYTTLSPYTGVRLDTSNISEIRFPLIPKNYDKTGVMVANSTEEEYSVKFTEIEVVNGFLNDENPEIEATGYSIAEDYDSTYSYCPRRLAREMRKLGYSEIVDLYIGASHFYCKNGVTGTKITDYKDMTLDSSKGINIAFRSWLESYCKNLLLNNVSSLVISVSLENLEMPEVWRQKLWNGQDGETGWQPPTNFYSLTNPNVREYIRNVSNECLEIVGQSGLKKIFQFGEPWWWCQSFKGGDVSVSNPSSPLAIYDSYTQSKFESDNGYKMPIYSTSTFEMDEQSTKVANWLNEQLQDYSNFMKSIAENNGALFTVLYYPPSTLSDNVPKFVNAVNTPFNAWNNNQLDYLELEDYEWVTGNSPQHQEVYTFGQDVLGYPTSKQQYFAGYVDNPGDAYEEWNLIFQAAEEAKEKGFANVFIWAGTQVREYNVIGIKAESNNTNQNNTIATACDTEYIVTLEEAQALVNAGYTVIGRTLNGDNPLSLNELKNIIAAGLKIIPIYVSNMNITKNVYENTQQGTLDAVNAATLAGNLGIPITATIYFTANYSNTQAELDYIVLPYFKGVKAQYSVDNPQYKPGIYGPRNTCLATEKAGYTALSFVEDANNIKSGNQGYSMPNNWAFNQTVASELNGLGYNKDISSGKDNGSLIINNSAINFTSLKLLLNELYLEAVNYNNIFNKGSGTSTESNNLQILEYLRYLSYNNKDWLLALGGPESEFYNYVKKANPNLSNELLSYISNDQILITIGKTTLDIPHLAATTQGYYYSVVPHFWTGWGGDIATLIAQVTYGYINDKKNIVEYANKLMAARTGSTFGLYNFYEDLDAIYLSSVLSNAKFSTLLEEYYIKNENNLKAIRTNSIMNDVNCSNVNNLDNCLYNKFIGKDGLSNLLMGSKLKGVVTREGELPLNYDVIKACCNAFALKIKELNIDGYL